MKPPKSFTNIPVVDLARWQGSETERAALAEEICTICHKVGFLQVVNHDISPLFMNDLFDMLERLFTLPQDAKLMIDKRKSRHFRGWEATGTEYTNNRPDIREQVDIWSETKARPVDILPAYLRLLGPNQWLTDDVLPDYRKTSLAWINHARQLATTLLGIMSTGLDLGEDYINNLFGDEQMSLTKFIRYPPTPTNSAGVNAHHDTGFLTVLAPGKTPGLEVQNNDGDWLPVVPVENGLVINLGEMLQGITGNYFVATPHRVITQDWRYAVGYFHGPSLHTRLEPLPLTQKYYDAVAASPHHRDAGFMARMEETKVGVGDMSSAYKPTVYGEQLWNYFVRSYPQIVEQHYPDVFGSM